MFSKSPGPSARCTVMQQPIVEWIRASRASGSSLGTLSMLSSLLRVFVSSWPHLAEWKLPARERVHLDGPAVGVDHHRAVVIGSEDFRAGGSDRKSTRLNSSHGSI